MMGTYPMTPQEKIAAEKMREACARECERHSAMLDKEPDDSADAESLQCLILVDAIRAIDVESLK